METDAQMQSQVRQLAAALPGTQGRMHYSLHRYFKQVPKETDPEEPTLTLDRKRKREEAAKAAEEARSGDGFSQACTVCAAASSKAAERRPQRWQETAGQDKRSDSRRAEKQQERTRAGCFKD